MYIAYNVVNDDTCISKEIAEFKTIMYVEDIGCTSIGLRGFDDIYLKMDKSDYDSLYLKVITALKSGINLLEIKNGVCMTLDDETTYCLNKYMEYAEELKPFDTFSYSFEY